MKFTTDNVDVPRGLLEALQNDTLVVFVGAGVSAKAHPRQKADTYYPNFNDLVREIGKNLGIQVSKQDDDNLRNGRPDRVLGEWARENTKIHEEAAQILQVNEAGQRIELHQALVRLFTDQVTPRIVTTNFDNLLRRALHLEHPAEVDLPRWRIHKAPSLPPANRFSGICHLHGCVDDPREMVLTDRDIGKAYMDEGWALRFAHELFRRFDVVFVGYSLEDPPLRYLSLALEGAGTNRRWAFDGWATKKNSASRNSKEMDWRRRGVEPIWRYHQEVWK